MVFNGLKGADLIVYNALREQELPAKVPTSNLSFATGYTVQTIIRVLQRLESYEMITRHRAGHGKPHIIDIVDDYALPHS